MELGPLSDIASEPGVTDIAVTCDGTVWVDRGQGMRPHALRVPFSGPQAIRDFAVRLCSQLGRRLDDACPIADASTVEACACTRLSHRSFRKRRHQHTIAGRCCAQSGIFGGKRHVSKRMDALAGRIRGTKGQRARDRRNRSRQNHAAQAMLMRCAPGERVITVEEVRELGMLNHANHVSLVTRGATWKAKAP